jgi:hypothetical protein
MPQFWNKGNNKDYLGVFPISSGAWKLTWPGSCTAFFVVLMFLRELVLQSLGKQVTLPWEV